MRAAVVLWLPFALSAVTIYYLYLAGNNDRRAWPIALVNQGFWLVWILSAAAWGLVPMNIAMWVVCWRNHQKWRGKSA